MAVDVICMSFQQMKHGVERMVMMEKLGRHLMKIVVCANRYKMYICNRYMMLAYDQDVYVLHSV